MTGRNVKKSIIIDWMNYCYWQIIKHLNLNFIFINGKAGLFIFRTIPMYVIKKSELYANIL